MALITDKIILNPKATASAPSGSEGSLYYDSDKEALMSYGDSWQMVSRTTGSGGTITTYTGFKVHTFLSDGTFSVSGGVLVCDILMVGGGGSGGGRHAGGGGGGGVLSITGASLPTGSYDINVGDGGAGTSGSVRGNSGENTTFMGEAAKGGGAGGSYNGVAGLTGGSGGGGGYQSSGDAGGSSQPGPTNYTGTGYANVGGTTPSGWNSGGPGGGAGEAGSTSTPDGGDGIQVSWVTPQALGYVGSHNGVGNTDAFYWGGGGAPGVWSGNGSNGGKGGGGGSNVAGGGNIGVGGLYGINNGEDGVDHPNNGNLSAGGHGGDNTGGGSGASGQQGHADYEGKSGDGGSGIVILRYVN